MLNYVTKTNTAVQLLKQNIATKQ